MVVRPCRSRRCRSDRGRLWWSCLVAASVRLAWAGVRHASCDWRGQAFATRRGGCGLRQRACAGRCRLGRYSCGCWCRYHIRRRRQHHCRRVGALWRRLNRHRDDRWRLHGNGHGRLGLRLGENYRLHRKGRDGIGLGRRHLGAQDQVLPGIRAPPGKILTARTAARPQRRRAKWASGCGGLCAHRPTSFPNTPLPPSLADPRGLQPCPPENTLAHPAAGQPVRCCRVMLARGGNRTAWDDYDNRPIRNMTKENSHH